MKRTIPLLITALGGFVLIAAFFIPAGQPWGEEVAVWFDILASIAFVLGGGNLLKVHLKKISDRVAGWGYSAVTLIAFFVTLWVGLFKVGVPPAPNTEFYGETFAAVPLEAMPVFRAPGTIPTRGDGERLPASARSQLRQAGGEVEFRGWMTAGQSADLQGYQDTLEWQALVETLAEAAQPPENLRGRVTYHADHQMLGYRGAMSDADRAAIEQLLANQPQTMAAVAQLQQQSRRETAIDDVTFPPGFVIPAAQADVVTQEGDRLLLQGPMSESLRASLVNDWPQWPRLRPLSAAERAAFQSEYAALGAPLTERQSRAFDIQLDKAWIADQLILALNTAGEASPGRKTARQLLAERDAGATELDPTLPAGESVKLTAELEGVIREFAADSTLTVAELNGRIEASGGPWSPAFAAALMKFLAAQPTLGNVKYDLARELLKLSRDHADEPRPTAAQLDWLLAETRSEAAWRQQVQRLFERSHVTKFPWSGEYLAGGSALHWCYEYLFQPLTATMFALLAFYVASAAFRAFRAKNTEAILLLGTAFLILIAQTPIGAWLTSWVPNSLSALQADEMKRYIMSLFNTAGNRAIMIGIALGTAATSLKILLGVDRSYLGGGED